LSVLLSNYETVPPKEQGEMSFVLFFYFLSLSASSSTHVLVGRHHEYIFSDAQGFSFANPITAVD